MQSLQAPDSKRFGWVTSYPRFRWVVFWWALFVVAFVLSGISRQGAVSTAATQLKDDTDTIVHRWWYQHDLQGYICYAILAVAAFITVKWVFHFFLSCRNQSE